MVATYTWAENGQATVTAGGNDSPAPGTVESWTISSSTLPAVTTGVSICACADTAAGLQTETVWITNITGSTATVVRGSEGTTPVTHTPPFTIQNVISVNSLLQQAKVDWQNVVTQYGADNSGATDATTAISDAITAAGAGVTYLPAGTYLLNSSSALSLATAGARLTGDGPGATIIQPGSSFSAAEAVAITASSCVVDNLSVVGANSGNSALGGSQGWNGIEVTAAQHCSVHDVFLQFVNGYPIESVGTSATANLDCMYRSVVHRNCAGGIHVIGNTTTSFNGEQFFTDIQGQQVGTTTGANPNLDAWLIEDIHDIQIANPNVGVTSGTGHAIHIRGAASGVFVTNADVGGGSGVVLIEDNGGNSPTQIRFTNGNIQSSTAGAGLHGTGAGSDWVFSNILFRNNQTDGCTLSNTGALSCALTGCKWNTNNQSNGTQYDLNLVSATTKWQVNGGAFITAVGSGAGKVTHPVNDPNSVGYFWGVSFLGTGTTNANVFAAGPALSNYCIGHSVPAAPLAATPANPATTSGTAALVMMGFGTAGCAYTPNGRGSVLVNVAGGVFTATSATSGTLGARYGSGTAPSNGAAVTGTRFGAVGDYVYKAGGPTEVETFAFTSVLPLTSGTAYWFDLAVDTSAGADVATVQNVGMTFVEQA